MPAHDADNGYDTDTTRSTDDTDIVPDASRLPFSTLMSAFLPRFPPSQASDGQLETNDPPSDPEPAPLSKASAISSLASTKDCKKHSLDDDPHEEERRSKRRSHMSNLRRLRTEAAQGLKTTLSKLSDASDATWLSHRPASGKASSKVNLSTIITRLESITTWIVEAETVFAPFSSLNSAVRYHALETAGQGIATPSSLDPPPDVDLLQSSVTSATGPTAASVSPGKRPRIRNSSPIARKKLQNEKNAEYQKNIAESQKAAVRSLRVTLSRLSATSNAASVRAS
jgi:hypothetical protein